MKEERAKRALRVYKGPDDPANFDSIINSLSFQCRNMDRLSDSPGAIYRLARETDKGGQVIVKRVGGQHPIDYIWTYGGMKILYGLLKSNIYGTVWFFNVYSGKVIKKIETDLKGLLVSCDESSFHLMSSKNHQTVSMLTKYGYDGSELFQTTFDAGQVYTSRSYNVYDILFGWLNDGGPQVTNTQYLYLYKDLSFIAVLSFETVLIGDFISGRTRTSTRVMDAFITDDYIFLLLVDTVASAGPGESLAFETAKSYVQIYDFEFTKVAESSKEDDWNINTDVYYDVSPVGLRVEKNKITYQYSLTKEVNTMSWSMLNGILSLSARETKVPSILTGIWDGGSGLCNSFGIINGTLWRWYGDNTGESHFAASYSIGMQEKTRATLDAEGIGFSSMIEDFDEEMYDVIAINYGLIVKKI